jgi:hypothetical protein
VVVLAGRWSQARIGWPPKPLKVTSQLSTAVSIVSTETAGGRGRGAASPRSSRPELVEVSRLLDRRRVLLELGEGQVPELDPVGASDGRGCSRGAAEHGTARWIEEMKAGRIYRELDLHPGRHDVLAVDPRREPRTVVVREKALLLIHVLDTLERLCDDARRLQGEHHVGLGSEVLDERGSHPKPRQRGIGLDDLASWLALDAVAGP